MKKKMIPAGLACRPVSPVRDTRDDQTTLEGVRWGGVLGGEEGEGEKKRERKKQET